MSKLLDLSREAKLPLDVVTQVLAFIGRREAGKTYAATKLAELMLEQGLQCVVLDPVGVWFGLRIAADGKSKGIDIPIFGGERGDIPLEPGAGSLVADLVVDRGIPVILDLSLFRKAGMKQFATAFAEQLFHRKKRQRSPMMLFLEESQLFVPQLFKGQENLLGAFEDIGKLGRNVGIGLTLIGQRPQSINKDVLNQTEALFAMQISGSQERDALRKWIVEKLGKDQTSLVDELPELERGVAYLWSPSWLRVLEKVHIKEKWTYNASATPKPGVKVVDPKPLSKDDLAKVREDMKATIARAEAEDPRKLQQRIRELEKQLAKGPPASPKVERLEVPVLKESEIKRLEGLATGVIGLYNERRRLLAERLDECFQRSDKAIGDRILKSLTPLDDLVTRLMASKIFEVERPHQRLVDATRSARDTSPRAVPPRRNPPMDGSPASGKSPAGDLGKGEQRILNAIAQHDGMTREHLSVLLGYRRSARDTYLQRLRAAGLIAIEAGKAYATDAGNKVVIFEPLPIGDDLLDYWLRRLPEGEARILGIVAAAREGIGRDLISERTGYKRSSRDTYLQRLRARQLVAIRDGIVVPAPELFT